VKHWHRAAAAARAQATAGGPPGPGAAAAGPIAAASELRRPPAAGEPESRVGSGCHGHVSTSCGHRDGRPLGIITVTAVTLAAADGGIRPPRQLSCASLSPPARRSHGGRRHSGSLMLAAAVTSSHHRGPASPVSASHWHGGPQSSDPCSGLPVRLWNDHPESLLRSLAGSSPPDSAADSESPSLTRIRSVPAARSLLILVTQA
jgi:hypothetical protein